MNKICEAGYEFRPEEVLGKHAYAPLLRYNNGLWTEDDGEWDMAFMSNPEIKIGGNYGWMIYFELPYYKSDLWTWRSINEFESKHFHGKNIYDYHHSDGQHTMLQDGYVREGSLNERSGWGYDLTKFKYPNNIAHASLEQNRRKLNVGHGNGKSITLNVYDSTIKNGLLRCADTKEIVKPPKILVCKDCGPMEFDHEIWQEVPNKIGWDEIGRIQSYHKQLLALSEMLYPGGRITNKGDYNTIMGMEKMLMRITDENSSKSTSK